MQLTKSHANQSKTPGADPTHAPPVQSGHDAPRHADISHFDCLPDAAMITVTALAAVLDQGRSTIWRKCHLEPDFPRPIRLGVGCTRFNVGAVRIYLAAKAATAAPPQRTRRSKREAA